MEAHNPTGLADLPVYALERLVLKLDALSFHNLCEAVGPDLESRLWDALGKNKPKLWKWWRETCFSMGKFQRQLFHEVVSSYDNILEREQRLLLESDGNLEPQELFCDIDATLSSNWEDVFYAFKDLIYKLKEGKMRVKNMDNLEEKIKMSLELTTEAGRRYWGNGKEVKGQEEQALGWGDPKMIVGTMGNIIYYLFCPWEEWNLRILEHLDKCEERRNLSRLCATNIRYITSMHIPHFHRPADCKGPGLPRIERLLIATCRNCTFIRPLMEGNGFCVPHTREPYPPQHTKMDPIIAMEPLAGNVFALWFTPTYVQFHRVYHCKVDPSRYKTQCFQQLHISQPTVLWDKIAKNKQFFLETLVRCKNPQDWEDASPKDLPLNYFPPEEFKKDYFELKMMSLRFGNYSVGIRNNFYFDDFVEDVVMFNWRHDQPQYYLGEFKNPMDAMENTLGGCQGYDMFLFWSDKAVACAWAFARFWWFHSWTKALEGLNEPLLAGPDYRVERVCICSQFCIGAVINGQIVLFQVTKVVVDNFVTRTKERSLLLEPIRLIKLDLCSLGLQVEQLTFDYDKGDPYLLLLSRDSKSNSALEFFIHRFVFSYPDEDKKSVAVAVAGAIAPQPAEEESPFPSFDYSLGEPLGVLKVKPDLFDLDSYPDFMWNVDKATKERARLEAETKAKELRDEREKKHVFPWSLKEK